MREIIFGVIFYAVATTAKEGDVFQECHSRDSNQGCEDEVVPRSPDSNRIKSLSKRFLVLNHRPFTIPLKKLFRKM